MAPKSDHQVALDDAELVKEERSRFMYFVAWVGVVMTVLLVGLGWIAVQINNNVEELKDEVANVEEAAINADVAATRASDDLSVALAEVRSTEGITTQELRAVFRMVEQIRIAVCTDHPGLEECQDP